MSDSSYPLGGSAYAQLKNCVGSQVPDISDAAQFKASFDALQDLIKKGDVVSGHDIGSGGLITTLLEMCFAENKVGLQIDLSAFNEQILLCRKPCRGDSNQCRRVQNI